MVIWATVIWVAGLLTAVPYAAYYLLFEAQRDAYAALITFILFWIFGYWGVAGPLIGALKVRVFFRSLERAHAEGRLREALDNPEAEALIIDVIATDNHLPVFVVRPLYRIVRKRLIALAAQRAAATESTFRPQKRMHESQPQDHRRL